MGLTQLSLLLLSSQINFLTNKKIVRERLKMKTTKSLLIALNCYETLWSLVFLSQQKQKQKQK